MRLRHLVQLNPPPSEVRHLPGETEVVFAPMESLADGLGGLNTSQTRPLSEVISGSYSFFVEGDLLLAKVTPCFENGKKAIVDDMPQAIGFATSEVHVIRPRTDSVDRRYLNYVFSSEPFRASGIANMLGAGGLRRVPEETILNYRLPVTDPLAQQRIADYLDRETARIDGLIEKKKRMSSLLKTRILSVVEAVFTELRVEGIQPRKLAYYVTKVGSGKTPLGGASVYSDSGVRFIRSQNVYNEGFRLDDVAFIPLEIDEEMAGTRVHLNDVLLNITGASIGRCAVATEEIMPANVNQHVCIIRPSGKIEPDFLRLAIISGEAQSQIRLASFSANREGLNFEQIRSLLIRVPEDIKTQRRLVTRIQHTTASIYRMLDKVERSVGKLHELRTALITAGVAGQIDAGARGEGKNRDSLLSLVGGKRR